MNSAFGTWRAEGGYLPAPPRPNPYHPPPPPMPSFLPAPAPVQAIYINPTFPPPAGPPLLIKPKPPSQSLVPPPLYTRPKPPAPKNPNAPPSLQKGMNYMFPASHTHIHIISKAAPIWEKKYDGKQLGFKAWKVPTTTRLRDVIVRTLDCGNDESKAKGWAITEVEERGGGRWRKGPTVKFGDDQAMQTCEARGWSSKRGGGMAPVWVVVHKV